ncbi:hypothetical protein OUZ56_011815 [Daphnia magna]|uniref:Uncharacterized protein n=1 Tax=Daphnia magna TaxID=35525 RepID=A0ABQ9Z185_9CRUS|nr:hypothetical protein OUZ56_011815 [Daphnia magna]
MHAKKRNCKLALLPTSPTLPYVVGWKGYKLNYFEEEQDGRVLATGEDKEELRALGARELQRLRRMHESMQNAKVGG